jgi:hypothetical protein
VGGPFNLITHFCLSIYSENARHFLAIIKPDLTASPATHQPHPLDGDAIVPKK